MLKPPRYVEAEVLGGGCGVENHRWFWWPLTGSVVVWPGEVGVEVEEPGLVGGGMASEACCRYCLQVRFSLTNCCSPCCQPRTLETHFLRSCPRFLKGKGERSVKRWPNPSEVSNKGQKCCSSCVGSRQSLPSKLSGHCRLKRSLCPQWGALRLTRLDYTVPLYLGR